MTRAADGLGRALGVRPDEGGRLLGVATLFALLEAGRALGEVGKDTLIQGRFGPTGELPVVMPLLYIGLGAIGLIVALGYTAALGRIARGPLFIGMLAIAAGLMVVARVALGGGSDAALLALWLLVAVVGTLLMTVTWTIAGATFDARQAKRLFPLLTAAAIAGAFIGSLLAGPVTRLVGAANLVVLEAAALLVAAPLVWRLVGGRGTAGRRPAGTDRPSVTADLRTGFDTVVASPLLSRIAIAYVLLAVLLSSVDVPFTISAAAAFPDETDRATALGILSAAITATSFLVSALVANRLFARFGVSIGAVLLPIVYLVGFAAWLVQFTFPTAAAFRFGQQVTQRGLSNASWSAFYNVVPADRRAQVLAFNDGVPGQLGTILSGLLLLAAGRLLAPEQVFWLGAATALITTILVLGIRRGYGQSLVAALRSGAAERLLEGGPGLEAVVRDPSVGTALAEALRAPEPGVREMAAMLLGQRGLADARAGLVVATADADPRVRAAAVRALARTPGGLTGAAATLERLAGDADPRVRAQVVVARAGPDESAVLALVADPMDHVRTTALEALSPTATSRPLSPAARAAAVRALDDPVRTVRAAAAATLGADDGPPDDLLTVMRDGWRRASTAALDALALVTARTGQDPAIREPVLAYAGAQVERTASIREARRVLLEVGSERPDEALLIHVLAVRERDLTRSLLGALGVLGAPEASGPIRRCLHANDPDVRAQAIEALESLGDRALARRVVALLEDGSPPTSDRVATLERLAHDDDPWLRRLAQACRGNADVAESTRSMTELEMMLALRRVSLFEGLDPEDLQRVAATAVERSYAPGDVLMAEGDLGDELIVLTEGSVRVERTEPDGSIRQIRTYDAGEHIGELAVLRERPRAAAVIAEPGGARGLAVSGDGLKAILRERPDAAMAMLATLAERISRQ